MTEQETVPTLHELIDGQRRLVDLGQREVRDFEDMKTLAVAIDKLATLETLAAGLAVERGT